MPVMTAKGQVTVPEAIRARMGWKPGDRLIFEINNGTVTVTKSPSARDLVGIVTRRAEHNGSVIARRPATWEEQRERAWREATQRYVPRQ
jgi:AbrB family looped-hinge helix DNA binding protein